MANELSDALHELRELREKLKDSERRYKESEVWLACFTALLVGCEISLDSLGKVTDNAARQYWERFK